MAFSHNKLREYSDIINICLMSLASLFLNSKTVLVVFVLVPHPHIVLFFLTGWGIHEFFIITFIKDPVWHGSQWGDHNLWKKRTWWQIAAEEKGVNRQITDGWIPLIFVGFRLLLLCTLARWDDLLRPWSRTEQSPMSHISQSQNVCCETRLNKEAGWTVRQTNKRRFFSLDAFGKHVYSSD